MVFQIVINISNNFTKCNAEKVKILSKRKLEQIYMLGGNALSSSKGIEHSEPMKYKS